MTIADIQYPTTLLTSFVSEPRVPAWIKAYEPDIVAPGRLKARRDLPEFTIVRSRSIDALFAQKAFLSVLVKQQESTPRPSKILFVFEGEAVTSEQLVPLLRLFPRPDDIEVAAGTKAGPAAAQEATAKLAVDRARREQAAAPEDVLGQMKAFIAATAQLRSPESGRLSADQTAEVFGLSKTALAALLGRSKQAVSKTPDAEALQAGLRPYERAARLLAVLELADFRKWLNLGNDMLSGASPIDLIRQGRIGVVGDLAENMLVGNPT